MIEAARALRPGIVLVVVLLAACGSPPEAILVVDTADDEVEINAEVADTPQERTVGLMNREELDDDAGMVFLVPEPTEASFWMKDTLIPLSVAFWDRGGRIFRILDMAPCRRDPCPSYEPGRAWLGAVEVNLGFFEEQGVRVGDRVRLERG
jgi:uncharacterized membrane protein (UPF0127 family)